MNAVTVIPSVTPSNLPNITVGRFEALTVSASTVAETLAPLDDAYARECHSQLTKIQPRLRAEHQAVDRAQKALAAAKAEMKRVDEISETIIDTSITVGRMLQFDDIAYFEHQDDAWYLSVEDLIAAFNARGEVGRAFAERFTQIVKESKAATAELNRATAEYTRATAAFSDAYRQLSASIAFGRAVLANLRIEVPRVTPKKKAKSPSPSPAAVNPSVPAPAPTPLPMPTPVPHS